MDNPSFIPVRSDFLSDKALEKIIEQNLSKLNKLCYKRITENEILEVEKVYYFIVTGGTEAQVLDFQIKRDSRYSDEEIVLLAYESNNSLAASLELLARFNQLGKTGRIIYLPDQTAHDAPNADIKNIVKKDLLKGSRIGEIGKPSDWLVASSPTAQVVKENWGADVIPIQISDLKTIYNEINDDDCREIYKELTGNSEDILEPTEKDIFNNIKVYIAMKKIIELHKLDAVTLRCFDLVIDIKTTGCFALSYLNDKGIIAGCEGDMVSTLSMLYVYKKTGRIPWMANPSRLSIEKNTMVIAHCTVPRSIVTDYTIRSHFESGIGVGIQGTFPKGDVTVFRVGGNNLRKLWLAHAKITSTSTKNDLCRTQIEVQINSNDHVKDLLEKPLGNHLIIVPGKFDDFPIDK